MLVLYYFQGEIGESLEQPNALVINNNNNEKITFGEFLNAFPFKNNLDHLRFRFRKEDVNYGYVWLDVSNRTEGLPVFNGVVTAKILKLDSLSVRNRKLFLKQKIQVVNQTGPFVPLNTQQKTAAAAPPVPPRRQGAPPASSATPAANNVDTNLQEENRSQKPSSTNSSSVKANKPLKTPPSKIDVFNDDEVPSPVHKQNQEEPTLWADATSSVPAHPQGDILSFDYDGYAQPQQQSREVADMLDFGPPTSSGSKKSIKKSSSDFIPASTSALDIDEDNPVTTAPLHRAALAARREDQISEKVQVALDFKKELDIKAEKEAQDFDSAREKHEKNLLNWATNNKEKRNIRTLLSTMHTVLPKDSKWKAIGLGDVLEPKQVKLQYRKAMLVVHPDHCINADSETKFICKRVFEALNEAWDEFGKKEGL